RAGTADFSSDRPFFSRQAGAFARGRGDVHRRTAKKNRALSPVFVHIDPALPQTISFRPFNAATLTVFDAGLALNIISSPVKGFTPFRAFVAGFLTTRIFRRPGRVNKPLT